MNETNARQADDCFNAASSSQSDTQSGDGVTPATTEASAAAAAVAATGNQVTLTFCQQDCINRSTGTTALSAVT